MPDTHDESATPVCSTSCDPNCDAVCHEDHVAGHKKKHWPYDCPAADRYGWGGSDFIAAAVKRLRGERDGARQQLAAMTARAGEAEAEVKRLVEMKRPKDVGLSGWTAEENAEFEQRYGVEAAMRLRAANDRVWQIVQELRQDAVNAGRSPYQDPMAQRLSAALVGDGQQRTEAGQ